MKRLLSISLLLVFLYFTTGYYAVFLWKQSQIRKEVKSLIKKNIPESELTLFKVYKGYELTTNKKLQWVKADKEFSFKDNLYDVVKEKYVNDTLYYYCIQDAEEKILFSDLKEHINEYLKDKPSQQKSSKALTDNLSKDFFPTNPIFKFQLAEKKLLLSTLTPLELKLVQGILTPPPRPFSFIS